MANAIRRPPRHARHIHARPMRLLRAAPLALVLVFAALGAMSGQRAHAARLDTAITGTVVNGTHSRAPVASQPVTLQALDGDGTRDLASATTDGQGRFAFANIPGADASVFAVYTRFQQGLFSTGAITVENGAQDVALAVYDVTTSDAALHVTSMTALLRDPRPTNGLIGVGEFVTFRNTGTTAFVGTTAPANGQPMGLLRFALPAGSARLTLGAGFAGAQSVQVATGFGATATVPPGDSQFAFAFDMPYTGTDCLFPLKAEYPTDSVVLLAPPSMRVESQDLRAHGAISASGSQYASYMRVALDLGTTLFVRLRDLPVAGEAPALDFGLLAALAVALALLLAGLVALYLRRGDLAAALRLAPAASLPRAADADAELMTSARHDAERARLLGTLLKLQQASPAGRLSASQYRQQAGQIRASLRALLAALPPGELAALADAVRPTSSSGDEAPAELPAPQPSNAVGAAEPSRVTTGGGR